MTCEHMQLLLESLALPQVRAGQHQALLRHIQHCQTCQQRWQQWLLQEEQLTLFFTGTPAPATLKDAIMRHLHDRVPSEAWETLRSTIALEISAQGIRRLLLHQSPHIAIAAAPAPSLYNTVLAQAQQQLEEYFRGERVLFQLAIDLQTCTPFARDVLAATTTIPYGEVRSYKWLAERLGRPAASRAVGNALHRNPVPILIPCHRVVKSDGSLGGYAFGHDLKNRLLSLERSTSPFVGCSSTRILCYRGCHHERRVQEGNRIHFGSFRAALESGYRPCKVCQPRLQEA